jgi:hypothetical protein
MNYKDKLELELELELRSCTTQTERGICKAILKKELLEKGYILTESGKLHEIMEEDNGSMA